MRCLLGVLLMFGLTGFVEAQVKPEKLYTVNFDNTSWDKVIDWLEKESGLMCITKDKPQGSITLKPKKEYTLGELIDLLNELLEQDNLMLHRQSNTFALLPADQKIAAESFGYLSHEELKKHGKTEYVQCLIQFKFYTADDIIAQIKKTLSPLGEATIISSNVILVRDKAAYARQVIAVLGKDFDDVIVTSPESAKVGMQIVPAVVCLVVTPCVTATPCHKRFHLFPLRKCR